VQLQWNLMKLTVTSYQYSEFYPKQLVGFIYMIYRGKIKTNRLEEKNILWFYAS